ncbi:hypothetical protein IFM89_008848 [Coptis chinensis]|uniref:Uncharacterized protein n=1 Tax=Coptis chinensis TaxID=261450 RepID=A0A835HDF8_9MAGN|nr:hypothetical protein IFM89_008848 [Coptis chinensis]
MFFMRVFSNLVDRYYDTYLPFLLKACNDENSYVRQAIVYEIEALSRLNVVIGHPNAMHSDNVMAYDNVVSDLGRYVSFIVRVLMLPRQIFGFHYMFFQSKSGCSCVVKLLANKRSDAVLLGPNNQYLPKIVVVFAEVGYDWSKGAENHNPLATKNYIYLSTYHRKVKSKGNRILDRNNGRK